MGISHRLARSLSVANDSQIRSQFLSPVHSAILMIVSACLMVNQATAQPPEQHDSSEPQSDFSISQLAPDTFPALPSALYSDEDEKPLFNPYQLNDLEPAIDAGIRSQESGQHADAIDAFDQALQITRIRYGLYSETQIPLLEGIIVSGMELSDWEMVDQRYAYMEHLYRKLYDTDDPRLEEGLQKISSFHVNAFNINLDGRREYHLRRAAALFRSRLEVAENTLAAGNPLFEYLNEGLEISRQHLYFMSSAYRERAKEKEKDSRENLLAELD